MNMSIEGAAQRFAGRTVLVTGAAGAVGEAVTHLFAREGAKLILADTNRAKLDALINSVTDEGHQAIGGTFDVTKPDEVASALRGGVRMFGGLDHVVICHGVRPTGPLDDPKTLGDFRTSFEVNVLGVYICALAALPYLKKSDVGSIVIFSSAAAFRGNAFMSAYCTSKAAICGLVSSMASEWADFGIRVNAIAPAQIESEMIAEQVGEERRRREERIPLGRYAKGAEMASVAAFLASPDASFVTGHTLCADGGYTTFGFKPKIY